MHPARHPHGHSARADVETAVYRAPGPWSRSAGVRGAGAVGREWREAAAEVDARLAEWRASTDALLAAARRPHAAADIAQLEARCTARLASLHQAVARQRAARNRVVGQWLRRDPEANSTDQVGHERVDQSRGDGTTGVAPSGPV